MPSQLLKDLQAEIEKKALELVPVIEGLEDYIRLNVQPDTLTIVKDKLRFAKTRQDLLKLAHEALENLDKQGYPEFDPTQVVAAVFADLKAQQDTITAALAKFTAAEEADKATIVAGTTTDQP